MALGIIVSLITVSTGLGSKKAIKEKLSDFSGHISIKSTRSNSSYNSTIIEQKNFYPDKIKEIPEVESIQKYATVSGILRNKDNFAGIIFKGVGKDFDTERFKKFLIAGISPKVSEVGFSNEIAISSKIANDLHLKVNDSIVAIFSKENKNPIYRKFEVVGIYKTDIKMIDDLFVIGGINQVRKIQEMGPNDIGGMDIFLKNINNIDEVFPKVEKLVGLKNYAEKATDKYPEILEWINIFDVNIALIIAIMLIVVVINIIMVLLILIIERTNSIGILKTLGTSNGQIRSIFINYTLLIMIPGIIIGNAVGIGLLLLQKYFGLITLNPENYYVSVVPVDLNPLYIFMISAGILVVSALSLILPSFLISKISPVKAIKYK